MSQRPQGGERAILVQLTFPGFDAEKALDEFKELAVSAQAEVVACVSGSRLNPDAKYYLGYGKAKEISEKIQLHKAELVLINHELSPSQERNLERLLQCRVVDRSGLILDIFAQRARTFEGKLQVELAQLQHLSTRLARGWTHLERQKGGIGLRGPGETQLETDRRLIRERIRSINKRLDSVRKSRAQNRRAREKSDLAVVSLVGYTNAGKSTLFNALTGERLYVADQLFATLDPTMRKIELPGASAAILTDTVGFIRHLPHHLIEAFRSTLEETQQADLLLHLIDVSDTQWRDRVAAVQQVLMELNADTIPTIYVFNKIDQTAYLPKMEEQEGNYKIWLSAKTGKGLALLREAIATTLQGAIVEEEVWIPIEKAELRAALYKMKAVLAESVEEKGWCLQVRLTQEQKRRLWSKPNQS